MESQPSDQTVIKGGKVFELISTKDLRRMQLWREVYVAAIDKGHPPDWCYELAEIAVNKFSKYIGE